MTQKERFNMGDFTKELNIIDFLGIGIPGCALVLLIMGGQVEILLWANFFGTECSELTRAIILIILGYIVGMLIHEIGDVIEKILWRIIWLDPKTYAAYVVGLDDLTETLKSAQKDTPAMDYGKENLLSIIHTKWTSNPKRTKWTQYIFAALMAFLSLFIISFILYNFILFFVNALESISKTLDPTYAQNLSTIFSITNYKMILYPVGLIITILLGVAFLVLYKHTAKIQHVRLQNPYIQTSVAGYGNSSKRVLFDGFRVTMRNFLITIMIINLYSTWKPISAYQIICKALALPADNAQQDSSVVIQCFFAVILLIIIRYFHYSYLKYKYSYEDYLKKHIEKQNGN